MNIVSYDVVKYYMKYHNYQCIQVNEPESWLWAEINDIYQPMFKK